MIKMIRLIEVKNYRCLKYISQPLSRFQVLIGSNASGKTTFFDVVNFISDIVSDGIDRAITNRTSNFNELTFANRGGMIELAIEVELPNEVLQQLYDSGFNTIRYEIRFGLNKETNEHEIDEERVLLLRIIENFDLNPLMHDLHLISNSKKKPNSILNKEYDIDYYKQIIEKTPDYFDNYNIETKLLNNNYFDYALTFKLGSKKSALGNLPADETKFPASTWLKSFLTEGIQTFILDSQNIKKASSPGQSNKFKTDGSNLPWVIENLKKNTKWFNLWIEHIQTAFPEIETINTLLREDDKHRYLKVRYKNGIEIPSWLVSDGTLRLLALTLPAYLPDFTGVCLIEEPENGIHPKAIETAFQSLSSVYKAQILLATHSPIILSLVDYRDILCFSKTNIGAVDIVRGDEHPKLRDWKGEENLSVIFAGGILS